MMVEVLYAVRHAALGKLPASDKDSIRTLLFGHLDVVVSDPGIAAGRPAQ
jgi:hypothetical protein